MRSNCFYSMRRTGNVLCVRNKLKHTQTSRTMLVRLVPAAPSLAAQLPHIADQPSGFPSFPVSPVPSVPSGAHFADCVLEFLIPLQKQLLQACPGRSLMWPRCTDDSKERHVVFDVRLDGLQVVFAARHNHPTLLRLQHAAGKRIPERVVLQRLSAHALAISARFSLLGLLGVRSVTAPIHHPNPTEAGPKRGSYSSQRH